MDLLLRFLLKTPNRFVNMALLSDNIVLVDKENIFIVQNEITLDELKLWCYDRYREIGKSFSKVLFVSSDLKVYK